MAGKYRLVFYETADGGRPVEEFLASLDIKMRAKMVRAMGLLEENGPELGLPHARPLRDGIHELRAQVGTDITRALFFYQAGKIVVVTNGFVKKSQQTPRGEMELAMKRRNDYLSRMERR
ncbi:MAG TPA: type II toxin-antitoxin system RelE/ParE family toxin [Candidatus Limnocylindria bacterium]|nr:type II toxin-antitoxin system RelE/ParE family toxin [Candidatus Limnocylindria bacterium]